MTSKEYNTAADFTVDNRKYFRIDDDVSLQIRSIDKSYSYESLHNYYEEKLADLDLLNEINYADEKFLVSANNVKNRYPDIYEYIQHLENKIHLISKKIEIEKSPDNKNKVLQRVNISASGMNFIGDEDYTENDYIEVRITLYPDNKDIYLIARVLRVNVLTINKKSISMEFLIINDANKEILIKHIHAKQLEKLHNQ